MLLPCTLACTTPAGVDSRSSTRMDCLSDCYGDQWLQTEIHQEWLREKGKDEIVAGPLGETLTSVESITLVRSPCLGWCPSYSVTLRVEGSVSWEGFCCVEHRGKRTGTISPWEFHRLGALISEIGFFDLAHSYEVNMTDSQAVFVSVTQEGRTKTVENYGSAGPARLWALEQLIDTTVKDVQWKK